MNNKTNTEAVPAFIPVMGELISTQNNRITADPLFCVFQKQGVVADADYDHDFIEWYCSERETVADATRTERLEALRNGGKHYLEDAIEIRGVEWRRVAVKEIDVFVTACFTEQGCKDYLALNGHNLRKPFIYVTSMYRNEEMKQLRNWIISTSPESEEAAA